MTRRHWFLPDAPDVLGLLRHQCEITIEGLEAFRCWAAGDTGGAAALTTAEHRGDAAKRQLLDALRSAFVTPLEPEDVFALSRSIDRIVTAAREIVIESEVLAARPDGGIAAMADLIAEAMRHIDEAIGALGGDGDRATACADAALAAEKRLDDVYYRGMAALLEVEDRSARIAQRELYRRCAGVGDILVDAAERVIYAVVKQS